MGVHDSVESLIKLPHRTKTGWLKHNTKNIETKLKKDRERKSQWKNGQPDSCAGIQRPTFLQQAPADHPQN